MSSSTCRPFPSIDWHAFPHIVEAILEHAPIASLFSLRLASRTLRDRIDPMLANHIIVEADSKTGHLSVVSKLGWKLRFPTPVVAGEPPKQVAELDPWPASADAFFSRVLGSTEVVDLYNPILVPTLGRLERFLPSTRTARIFMGRRERAMVNRHPEPGYRLTEPVNARECVYFGPTDRILPYLLKIPEHLDRLVINSPLCTPGLVCTQDSNVLGLHEAVFIYTPQVSPFSPDRHDLPAVPLHKQLLYSIFFLLGGQNEPQVYVVGLENIQSEELGQFHSPPSDKTKTDLFREQLVNRASQSPSDEYSSDWAALIDRVHFLTEKQYRALRPDDQVALEFSQ